MRKNVICLTLCAMLFALSVSGQAQQSATKVPRLGYLDSGSASDPQNAAFRDAFLQGLRDLGYVEGKNINIEYRHDEGKPERLQALAEELIRLKVDILLGMDTSAAQAAKKSTTSIPVIFTTGGSPIASGLAPSLARPGGNVTGVTINSPELVGKRLELLKEAVPKVSRFAFLSDADSASIKAMFNEAQQAAKALGIQFKSVEVKGPKPDIEGAVSNDDQGAPWRPRYGRATTHQFSPSKDFTACGAVSHPRDIPGATMDERRWAHVLRSEPN